MRLGKGVGCSQLEMTPNAHRRTPPKFADRFMSHDESAAESQSQRHIHAILFFITVCVSTQAEQWRAPLPRCPSCLCDPTPPLPIPQKLPRLSRPNLHIWLDHTPLCQECTSLRFFSGWMQSQEIPSTTHVALLRAPTMHHLSAGCAASLQCVCVRVRRTSNACVRYSA